jgi:hypothetical protein
MLDLKTRLKDAIALLAIFVLCILLIREHLSKNALEKSLNTVSNALIESSKTIEVQKGVFEKRSVELENIKILLAKKDNELLDVTAQLKKEHSQALAYSELSIMWKKKYEGAARATQTVVVDNSTNNTNTENKEQRLRVDFSKEAGPFDISGYTVTSPPEAFVSLKQSRPIKLGVVVSRSDDGKWSSIVSTPKDADYGVDIVVSAIDKDLHVKSWRDKFSIDFRMGIYEDPSIGAGLKYGEKLSFGPDCSVYSNGELSWSCGVSMSWRPFLK